MRMDIRSHDIRFHHVGVITGNIEGSINFYVSLGYAASPIYADPIQRASIVLMQRGCEPVIELITPDCPDSPAASWRQLIQVGPYHTCYEVDNLEAVMLLLQRQYLFPVFGPVPAVAFDMRRVVFLWGNNSGLIEFLEARSV
jgi:methylmalonyl-CoA/ethylmalonyl-CoA epimerase